MSLRVTHLLAEDRLILVYNAAYEGGGIYIGSYLGGFSLSALSGAQHVRHVTYPLSLTIRVCYITQATLKPLQPMLERLEQTRGFWHPHNACHKV